MPTPAAAPYVLDPAYQPTDEDTQLIDSICAHVRKHPELYESAVHEIDRGKFSFKSLAADRADFEAAAKKDDARAKKFARKKGQAPHRSWLKQNAPDPRRAIDWREMRRQRPEVVDLLRINAVRDELLMNGSGLLQAGRGSRSAKLVAPSVLECLVIFVMTSVMFDADSFQGNARTSLQKVPWEGPPLEGRKTAQRVMEERGELKNWIAMARRAASKLRFPLTDEASEGSPAGTSQMGPSPDSRDTEPATETGTLETATAPDHEDTPLSPPALMVAAVLCLQPLDNCLTAMEITRRVKDRFGQSIDPTTVKKGVLKALKHWGMRSSGKAGYFVPSQRRSALLTRIRPALKGLFPDRTSDL